MISSISLLRATNGAHFDFFRQEKERLQAAGIADERFQARLSAFSTAFAEEDRCFRISQKSLLTDEIAEADTQRDQLYLALRRQVKAYVGHPVAALAAAARPVWQRIKDYNIDVNVQLNRESGEIDNLLQDLATHTEQTALLGIDALISLLRTENEKVKTLMAQRNDERADIVKGELKAARRATDLAWNALAEYLGAYIIITDTPALRQLEQQINKDIAEAKRKILATHGSSATDDGTEDDGGTDDGGDDTGGDAGGGEDAGGTGSDAGGTGSDTGGSDTGGGGSDTGGSDAGGTGSDTGGSGTGSSGSDTGGSGSGSSGDGGGIG